MQPGKIVRLYFSFKEEAESARLVIGYLASALSRAAAPACCKRAAKQMLGTGRAGKCCKSQLLTQRRRPIS